jgi:hypothetical protein
MDIVAWNSTACAVWGPLDTIPARERNLLRIVFGNRALRHRLVNWESSARHLIGRFKVARVLKGPAERFDEVVSDLLDDTPEFKAWWDRDDLRTSDVTQDRFELPEAGLVVLDWTPLQVLETEYTLVLGTPDPKTDSRAKLERLVKSTPDRQSATRLLK